MPDYILPPRACAALHAKLADLATAQRGVVRRQQLARCGLSAHVLESMIAGRRWQVLGAVVIVLHNGQLSRDQQLWAAVLNAGNEVGVAARTAAAEYGLVGWEAECIEILVPRSTHVPPGLGFAVKVHESRRFSLADLHPGRTPPTVRIERALIDAAVWSRGPRTACGILAAGVQQRLTTPARLRDVLDAAGAVRHRRMLAAALSDIEGGAQAMSEIDFLRFCRRHQLPRPELQAVRTDRQGRRRYLDATFRRADGHLVRVEVDGALHLVARTYWDDMSRGNELVIDGERVLRFPSFVVYAGDAAAVDQLRRALQLSDRRPALAG